MLAAHAGAQIPVGYELKAKTPPAKAAPLTEPLPADLASDGLVYEKGPAIEPLNPTPYPRTSMNRGTAYFLDAKIGLTRPADVDSVVRYFQTVAEGPTLRSLAESRLKEGKPILLSEILPSFVRENIGKFPEEGNCFNTTLNFHNPAVGVKHTSREEMRNQLTAHYRSLRRGETLSVGDVLIVTGRHGIVHSAVYVGQDLFFHKATAFSSDPYGIESYREVMAYWKALRSGPAFARYHGEKR